MRRVEHVVRSAMVSLKSVLTASNFWIAVMLVFLVLSTEIFEAIFSLPWRQNRFGLGDTYFFNFSLHFGYFIYAAPLACAFAASGTLVNDVEAGFYRLHLMKSGRIGYKNGLYIRTTIGGGLSLMLGVLLFGFLCMLVYLPHDPAVDITVTAAWQPILSSAWGNIKYMLLSSVLAFSFGMVWSGVGLLFSVLSANRYVCYLAPFIACMCAALMLPTAFNPFESLVQLRWVDFSFKKLYAYELALYIIAALIFNYAFERRLVRGKD